MEKQEILAKIAKLLTAGWITTYESREFKSFSQKTDKEKRICKFIYHETLPYKYMYKLYRKENNIVLARKIIQFAFMRNRFFLKSEYATLMTITPKRVFCNTIEEASRFILQRLDCDDIKIKTKRELRDLIIKGKLPTEIIIDPKIMNVLQHFGPTELETYTTNKNHMVSRLVNSLDGSECGLFSLIRDMILQCKALNVKINSEWSYRRMQDQHNRWNDEINIIRHRNCSESSIWNIDNIHIPDYIELINSERRCADEGDNMNHCLYNCYNHNIQSKRYMAFHIKSETGDFTVGIRIDHKNTVCFDQAFKAYNKEITNDDKARLNEILKMAQSIVDINVLRDTLLNPDDYCIEDIDFHF